MTIPTTVAPGPLVLAGGPSWSALDLPALVGSCGAREIVVLPTAAAFEGVAAAVDHVRAVVGSVTGLPVIEAQVTTRTHAGDAALADVVRAARLIVLPGESSLHARAVLKDAPVWEALLDAWRGGAAVVGIGGGAAVLCDPMIDDRGGAFTLGLGLVPQTALLPHADRWSADRLKRTVRLLSSGVALVSVDDEAVLAWTAREGWQDATGVRAQRDGEPISCAALEAPRI